MAEFSRVTGGPAETIGAGFGQPIRTGVDSGGFDRSPYFKGPAQMPPGLSGSPGGPADSFGPGFGQPIPPGLSSSPGGPAESFGPGFGQPVAGGPSPLGPSVPISQLRPIGEGTLGFYTNPNDPRFIYDKTGTPIQLNQLSSTQPVSSMTGPGLTAQGINAGALPPGLSASPGFRSAAPTGQMMPPQAGIRSLPTPMMQQRSASPFSAFRQQYTPTSAARAPVMPPYLSALMQYFSRRR